MGVTTKDLAPLQHFLGVIVERQPGGLFLQHSTYLKDIIDRAGMIGCKLCTTFDLHSGRGGLWTVRAACLSVQESR
jgi:hypothetical protein